MNLLRKDEGGMKMVRIVIRDRREMGERGGHHERVGIR